MFSLLRYCTTQNNEEFKWKCDWKYLGLKLMTIIWDFFYSCINIMAAQNKHISSQNMFFQLVNSCQLHRISPNMAPLQWRFWSLLSCGTCYKRPIICAIGLLFLFNPFCAWASYFSLQTLKAEAPLLTRTGTWCRATFRKHTKNRILLIFQPAMAVTEEEIESNF